MLNTKIYMLETLQQMKTGFNECSVVWCGSR